MPTDQELNQFLALAKPEFLELFKKPRISPNDFIGKEWIERYAVAVELWHLCDFAARRALLEDPNPSVRSAALQKQNNRIFHSTAAAKESTCVSQATL